MGFSMRSWRRIFVLLMLADCAISTRGEENAGTGPVVPSAPNAGSTEADFFEAKIRPLFAARCQECHGSSKQEMGVRFDRREAFFRGGDDGAVVQNGDPEKSLLIQAVRQTGDVKMPPKSKLPDEEIALLTEWVKIGTPWPYDSTSSRGPGQTDKWKEHWSFQPVHAVDPPVVKDETAANSPIDRFVLAKLDAVGLQFSPPADKRTLIRRAYYDLTGLPPTPEQTAAFVNDQSPDAFRKVIDELLESPHYGERWARYWLDVARYADTKGYVFEEDRRYPFAYNYRDWVIESLNGDLPYNQFVAQQIAADLMPHTDDRSLAALGFLTLGRRFLNNRNDIIDDRLDVVFRGTQGLTVSCARCHDHKFDPIPTDDYYSLYGVFDSCDEKVVQLEPATEKYQAELNKRKGELTKFVNDECDDLSRESKSKAASYLLAAFHKDDTAKADQKGKGKDKDKLNQQVVVRWQNYLDGPGKRAETIWAPLRSLSEDSEEEFSARLQQAIAQKINPILRDALQREQPDSFERTVEVYAAVLQDIDAQWKAKLQAAGDAKPEKLDDANAEELRQVFYGERSPAIFSEKEFNKLLPKPRQAEYKKVKEAVASWESSLDAPRQALVLNDGKPKQPHVFVRGNANKQGKAVPRQFPAVVAGDNRQPFKNGSGRLELAEQISSPANPLTARVIVNRVWMYHFGAPLVSTPSDFGMRSDEPTHPELLDWLANDFMGHGWSLKYLHRAILLSSAYQQASLDRPEGQSADPENRLLWKMNRRRLDWESMRDSLLSASGSLDLKVSGPAIDLFAQPFSLRRSIYGYIDRQNLPGVYRTFDLASPDTHSPRRFSTTVPQQALYLMNNAFAAEQAKRLANRDDVKQAEGDARIERLFEILWSRPPTSEELKVANDFIKAGGGWNDESSKTDSKKPSRWEQLAQALLMTNEFVYID
jgi:mono/diheme cytochrome c family protein